MFDKSTRRRRLGLVSIATLGAAASLTLLPFASALADVTTGFELDGNVLDNTATAPPDWGAASGSNSIFTVDANGAGVARTPLPTNFLSAGFTRDFIPGSTADNTTYTNGSKDINNIGTGWACVSSSNVTDKGDIQNGYASAYNDPVTGDLMLYFGMEKNAPNGDNNMGVWFLQDPTVACNNPNGGAGLTFTGNHTDGDILLVAAFTSGGTAPTVSAYRWNGNATTGSLGTTPLATGGKCGLTTSTNLCAITNDTAPVTTPWLTTNKASQSPSNKTGQGNTLGTDQFYEGAVDLTANHLDTDSSGNAICVNKFVFDTRSSQSLTATLYDYAEGNVRTCAAPTIATNLFLKQTVPPDTSLAPPNNTVTLPALVYDTASITGALGTPSGTVTYSLWTNNACTTAATAPTFTGGTNSAAVTIAADGTIPPSPTLLFDTPGSFWWKAVYSGGGRNSGNTSVCADEPLVVNPVQPGINTVPSVTSVVIGGNPASFSDRANITGGYFPSGGITVGDVAFKLYGPFATSAAVSCAGTPVFTSTNAAARDTNSTAHAISSAYTPTTVGVYQWTAAYAGNAQNKPVASACNDTTEQVTVTPATPTIASKILLSDTAKVSGIPGAGAPAGSVVFSLFPSNNCTGTALYTSPATAISASGTASTSTATAVVAGNYSWQVVFTPDTSVNPNYVGASTSCSPADEQATISYNGTSPSP